MPCTTILAGKKATNDGSTLIARNDDGLFEAKRILVIKPENQKKTYKSVISHLTIELPDNPLQYTCAPNVCPKNGTWPACGINAANVAMTATETTTSNPRVMGADPLVVYQAREGRKKEVPGGIGEEDLVTIVLPYIKTAREGVLRLGALLEQYGTYESNGIAFADAEEIWWLETIGGHHWMARRVDDETVVIMPNQFGLDRFDFDDAYGARKDNLCSADLKDFIKKYHLDANQEGTVFNPRLVFGSQDDSDHIYNTPRAWFMARYFNCIGDCGPESNDIPWCFVPDRKCTVEDIRYLLGSHYQGTAYDPYDKTAEFHGKYRTIGVPNSDICGIMQIRGYMPEKLQAVEWVSLGGSGFTACFPFYASVDSLPAYINGTTEEVNTNYMYWQSRLIAALLDAHYFTSSIFNERYLKTVLNKGHQFLNEYDAKFIESGDSALLTEANREITKMVKKESDKVLGAILKDSSEHMKIRFHRGDN